MNEVKKKEMKNQTSRELGQMSENYYDKICPAKLRIRYIKLMSLLIAYN